MGAGRQRRGLTDFLENKEWFLVETPASKLAVGKPSRLLGAHCEFVVLST